MFFGSNYSQTKIAFFYMISNRSEPTDPFPDIAAAVDIAWLHMMMVCILIMMVCLSKECLLMLI